MALATTALLLLMALATSYMTVDAAPASHGHQRSEETAEALLQEQLEGLNLPELMQLAREGEEEEEFTAEDELQLMDDLMAQTEQEVDDERQLSGLLKSKRFTMDFNGMQVSYPTYVRLSRLQEKVLKLQRTIQMLHRRYTEEQLSHLPQYQRLMTLFTSLQPLLPTGSEGSATGDVQDVTALAADEDKKRKRTPFTMDFMGMRVSYPQYLRLVSLQEKVVKLDQIMRRMRARVPLEQLEQVPKWHTLVALHASLSKMLPAAGAGEGEDHPTTSNTSTRKKRAATRFNDIYVTMPDYGRLMGMQRAAVKLDQVMRKMLKEMDAEKLMASPKWKQLVDLRKSLQKLMPEGHPEFLEPQQLQQESEEQLLLPDKRVVMMDFNGVRVSYPEYVRLSALQRKVQKLDSVMERIRQLRGAEELDSLPQWRRLLELRRSLVNLQPLLQ